MTGNGNIVYGSRPGAPAGFVNVAGANDGLSLSALNFVQLGQLVGAAGNPAKLLSAREIPTQGFSLLFSGAGAAAAGNLPVLIFQEDATKLTHTPFQTFLDSAGNEIGRISFDSSFVNDDGSVYIGSRAGQVDANLGLGNNVGVGWRSLTANTSGFANSSVGYESLFNNTTGNQNSSVGASSLFHLTTGTDNTGVGFNSLFQLITGTKNTSVGSHAGEAVYLASTENVSVGYFAGYYGGNFAVNTTGNVAIGSQAFFMAALMGNFNIAIGYHCMSVGGQIGDHCILIGDSINVTAGGPANFTVLGHGITCNISNVAIIGRADQNVILGTTVSPTDTGQRLQVLGNALVNGTIQTGNPGLGAGTWELGVLVTAAITTDLTKYVQISIGGTTYKLVTAN